MISSRSPAAPGTCGGKQTRRIKELDKERDEREREKESERASGRKRNEMYMLKSLMVHSHACFSEQDRVNGCQKQL